MSVDSAIRRFRSRQAEQFTEEATVHRQVGEPTTNPTTGAVTRTYGDVYDGPCKIRPADRSGRDVTAGETRVLLLDMAGKFPVDTDLRQGDVVVVASSLYDATLVARQYRITEAPGDGWQIAKVVGLEETDVPELYEEGS